MKTREAKNTLQTNNKVLLTRKNSLFIKPDVFSNPNHVTAMNLNIASLGYTLSPDLCIVLNTKSVEDISDINNFLVETLSEMVGANVRYKPFFRNFPKDVPTDAFEHYIERLFAWAESELGLTENAKLLSCGHLIDTEKFDMSNFSGCPICQKQLSEGELLPSKERKPFKGKVKLKTIELAEYSDVFNIFKNLLSSKTSISEQDKKDIKTIMEYNRKEVEAYFPEIIPHKEVLGYVSKLVIENLFVYELIEKSIKTATDVLRIATAMSEGDVSLATNTKYKKFNKTERKFLLFLLEKCNNIEEDMVRYKGKWIRLGEILHPLEYKKRFPKLCEAFCKIRNGVKIKTFNSATEALLINKEYTPLVKHLKARPSELARKFDLIISNCSNVAREIAFKELEAGVAEISTPVLFQMLGNFRIRATKDKDIRMIMPKGSVAKMKVLEETRQPMMESRAKRVIGVINTELKRRFSELEPMGTVYVDEKLSNYVIPFSQRSASKTMVTITRGSQIDFPVENTIRMFMYWKGGDGNSYNNNRIDLDLSAIMLDEYFGYVGHISYTNYRANEKKDGYKATYSGDFQSGEHGASEFIDIDVDSFNGKARYIAMNILSYTGQKFNEIPVCYAGFMGREHRNSGEVFEPKTVKQKFDITSETTVCIPMIFDIVEKKVIWADMSLKGNNQYNNVETHFERIGLIAKAISKMNKHKANIYELLMLHAKSRGKTTSYIERADVVFDETNIPFEIDTIIGKYLI